FFKVDSKHQVLFHLAVFCLMLSYAFAPNPRYPSTIPFLSWLLITLGGLSVVSEALYLGSTAAPDQVPAAVTMYLAGAVVVLSLSPLATYHLANHIEWNGALWTLGALVAAALAQMGVMLTWMYKDGAKRWSSLRWVALVFAGLLSTSYMTVV